MKAKDGSCVTFNPEQTSFNFINDIDSEKAFLEKELIILTRICKKKQKQRLLTFCHPHSVDLVILSVFEARNCFLIVLITQYSIVDHFYFCQGERLHTLWFEF